MLLPYVQSGNMAKLIPTELIFRQLFGFWTKKSILRKKKIFTIESDFLKVGIPCQPNMSSLLYSDFPRCSTRRTLPDSNCSTTSLAYLTLPYNFFMFPNITTFISSRSTVQDLPKWTMAELARTSGEFWPCMFVCPIKSRGFFQTCPLTRKRIIKCKAVRVGLKLERHCDPSGR